MVATAFCKHIRGFIEAALAVALHAHGPPTTSTTYDYHISGYFGSCHYFFTFAPIDDDFR
jgi:hypothetical protein